MFSAITSRYFSSIIYMSGAKNWVEHFDGSVRELDNKITGLQRGLNEEKIKLDSEIEGVQILFDGINNKIKWLEKNIVRINRKLNINSFEDWAEVRGLAAGVSNKKTRKRKKYRTKSK